MAKLSIVKASLNVTVYIFVQDSSATTGVGLTGLVYNSSGLVCYYVRPLSASAALTLATQTVTGAHSDGGFVEIDSTNMPGFYRLDLSDAICATGVDSVVVMLKGSTNMAPVSLEIQLTAFDLNDSTALATQASVDTVDGIVDAILLDTAEIGAAGAGLTALATQASVDTVDGIVDNILVDTAEIGAAGAGLTALATQASVNTVDSNVDAILLDTAEIGAAGAGLTALATQASVNTVDGIVDNILVDTAEIGAAGAGLTALATQASVNTVDSNVDAILLDTAEIGSAGVGLTAIPWNAAWDAEVESEANDALIALHLDHLLAVDYDPAAQPGIATALLNELIENNAGVSRYTAAALAQGPGGGGDGSGLTAIPWNAAWDAEVESEVNDGLVALHLDHLLAVDYDPAAQPGIATALLNELIENNAGVSRYTAAALAQGPGGGGDGSGLTAIPWNAAWDAEVESEVNDGLVALGLDHLVGAAVTGTDVVDDSIIASLVSSSATADWDDFVNTTESLQALRDRGDAAWITGGGGGITDILNIAALIPATIDLADTATYRLGIMLVNSVDDLPTTAEITPGTVSIDRKAIGGTSWSAVVTDAACLEAAGLIYYDEVFDTGTGYVEGDSIRVTFKSQKITVAANDYEISDATGRIFYSEVRQTMRGTDSAYTGTPPTAIAIRTEVDSNSTQLAAIVADTNELQGDWADAGRLDAILDARATQASVNTVDSNVDALLIDTAAIEAGLTTVDSNVDAILIDTAEIGAAGAGLTALATQASVDTVDGIVDNILVDTAEIGAAGAGLTALATQASVNTVDGIVDNILVDTAEIGAAGAGLTALATQASVNTVDSNVDAILLDTAEIGAAGAGLTSLATQASITALNDISVADILTTQMTQSYAADATAPTLAQALFLIQQSIGDFSISGTTLTVKQIDGSTSAATYTLDDAADPTSRTRAT